MIYGVADEPCDFGAASLTNNTDGVTWLGCTDSCTVAPGWECEVTIHSLTSERLSKCTQTCGDGTLDTSIGEACDTGNAYYNFLQMDSGGTSLTTDLRTAYNAANWEFGYMGCSASC